MYNDPIINKIFSLIKEKIPGVFKGFYQGDPFRIPKTMIPALIIAKSQTNIGVHNNAEDLHQIGLSMTIITDIRDERGDEQSNINSMQPGIAQLYDIIEGRNETTYKLKDGSILNILRKNQIVDESHNLRIDLGSITRADYGLTLGKRIPDGYATEGTVEFLATYTQIRS